MKFYISQEEYYPFYVLSDYNEEDLNENDDNSWYLDDVYDIPEELVNKYNTARKELGECFKQLRGLMSQKRGK